MAPSYSLLFYDSESDILLWLHKVLCNSMQRHIKVNYTSNNSADKRNNSHAILEGEKSVRGVWTEHPFHFPNEATIGREARPSQHCVLCVVYVGHWSPNVYTGGTGRLANGYRGQENTLRENHLQWSNKTEIFILKWRSHISMVKIWVYFRAQSFFSIPTNIKLH